MRTTLTIDDDVTVALERVRHRESLTLKAVVNEALRRGLRVMEAQAEAPKRERYVLRIWNSGGMRIQLDNVAEALVWAEGDGHR